jgi:predicted transcriptional regulator of viral defense system
MEGRAVLAAEREAQHGIRALARILAHRLARKGWLLEARVAGVWEFAPADRASPISDADRFLTLRASLARNDLPIAIALGSALWLHNLADRSLILMS